MLTIRSKTRLTPENTGKTSALAANNQAEPADARSQEPKAQANCSTGSTLLGDLVSWVMHFKNGAHLSLLPLESGDRTPFAQSFT
jgi:hypothetical protein